MIESEPRSAPGTDIPDRFALIIGAMKSGTTTLFEMLGQHPQIAAATVKEVGYFSNPGKVARGFDWYCSHWDWDGSSHRVALEASPAYTQFPARPGVPKRIAEAPVADFRFIYIMRNPLDQIESTVRHTLYAGWGQPLDEGIPDWMIETASYATQLDEYLKVFPEEQFLLLTLEEYSRSPLMTLRRVCEFLGVDVEFEFENVRSRYNTGELYEAPQFVARLIKWPTARSFAKRIFPRSLHHRIRSALGMLPTRNESLGRYELSDGEKAWVIEQLSEDLRRLETRYGVDTARNWSIDQGCLKQ